jgi:L-alanine-DL-glutamate epimerase-like enolase superfamily enzyme
LMRRDLTGSAFELEDTPGLGLRIDHDVLREYRIEV